MGSENDYPWKETDRLREEVQRTSSGIDRIRVRQGRWPVSMARCLPSVSHHVYGVCWIEAKEMRGVEASTTCSHSSL
ncbi:hypothetical protein AAC387_Pa01g1916 [Persea americana]